MATFGVSSFIVLAVSVLVALLFADWGQLSGVADSPGVVGAVLYSALVVALLVRALNVKVYEHIGSAAQGGLSYAEAILAIIIPILVLGEQLSIEIVIGGGLILLGLFVLENHHQWRHREHLHGHGVSHR